MHDPQEGATLSSIITTGVGRQRVSGVFEPVSASAVDAVHDVDTRSSVYLYGSVATGMAQPLEFDVDLITVGITRSDATEIGRTLSGRFSAVCSAVEVVSADVCDFVGGSDEAYGGRVFLRHCRVHLAGPDPRSTLQLVSGTVGKQEPRIDCPGIVLDLATADVSSSHA